MEKLYVFSDVHLGAQSAQVEKLKVDRLHSFLKHVSRQRADLVICGDLFDFWFEYRHAVPKRHFQIIAQLAQMVSDGHKIYYIAGNHDFWLGSFMEQEVGLTLCHDDLELQVAGKRIYFRHGDGLLKNDHLYRILKRVLRNPMNIQLYRLLHPDIGVPLALFFSHQSREASKDDPRYCDLDYREFAFRTIEKGYDVVVLGHTHWPALEQHHHGFYVNAGNWIDQFTFAILDHHAPQVKQWDGDQEQGFILTFPPGNVVKNKNVSTLGSDIENF